MTIDHRADWWLGSPDSKYSKALAQAIEREWGVLAVNIREGGVSLHDPTCDSTMNDP